MAKLLSISICFCLIMVGCTSVEDYLDINEDQNNPTEVPLESQFPSILLTFADVNTGQIVHFANMFLQHTEGQGRCGSLNSYTGVTPKFMDRIWTNAYEKILNEIRVAKVQADNRKLYHHKAILLTVEAYQLLTLTDFFGDIPYSEALQGLEFPHPNYDSQAAIFDVLLSNLQEAQRLFDGPSGNLNVGNEDLLLGGDMSLWKKVVPAIRARAMLHLGNFSEAKAAAEASFQTEEENWTYKYDGGENSSAWWYRFNRDRTGDLSFHPSLRYLMLSLNDTLRLDLWNQPYNTQHSYFTADQKVELMTYREMQFIIAECEHRLNGASPTAHDAYINGINAAFKNLALDPAVYLEQDLISSSQDELTLEDIITQKYIALFCQPEVWSDYRRTNLPELSPTSGPNLPVRFHYPEQEYLLNKNAPAPVDIFTDKVGWHN